MAKVLHGLREVVTHKETMRDQFWRCLVIKSRMRNGLAGQTSCDLNLNLKGCLSISDM